MNTWVRPLVLGASARVAPCARTAQREGREAEGGGRKPAGRAGKQGSSGRELRGQAPRSGRGLQPCVGPRAVRTRRRRAPPPVGGPRTRRRGGGAWLSAPGAGPDPGSPGRWRTRLVGRATGAPATKGCDPPLAPPSRLRSANQSGFYWRVGRAGPAAPRLWHGNVPARGWRGPGRSHSAPGGPGRGRGGREAARGTRDPGAERGE